MATDGQSVSLGVEPHLGLMTRCLLLFDSCGLVFVGGALSDERTGLSFVRVIVCSSKSFVRIYKIFTFYMLYMLKIHIQYTRPLVSPGSVQQVMPYFWCVYPAQGFWLYSPESRQWTSTPVAYFCRLYLATDSLPIICLRWRQEVTI
jgi:hypothetical protein